MQRKLVRFALTFLQTLCLIGMVIPFFLVRQWSAMEVARVEATNREIRAAGAAIREWCMQTNCTRYPLTGSLPDLAREIGPPFAARLASRDGWGRSLEGLSHGDGFVIVSAGADGRLEPDVRALLSLEPGDTARIAQAIAVIEARARAKNQGTRAAQAPWYRDRDTDIVFGTEEFITATPLLDASAVPPDVLLRYAFLVGLPSLLVFVVVTVARRRLNRTARVADRKTPSVLGRRLLQACCVAGLFLPIWLTSRWVAREKQPIRETFQRVASTASALEQNGCAQGTCGRYPEADSAAEVAQRVDAALSQQIAQHDGWGRPLHVRAWATRYVIASGGADGKLDADAARLLAVPRGDDATFDRLAEALRDSSKEQVATIYRSPHPRWYLHAGYDVVYASGRSFVKAFPLENPSNSFIEAPSRVLYQYASWTTLPSLVVLIVSVVIRRSGALAQETRPRRSP